MNKNQKLYQLFNNKGNYNLKISHMTKQNGKTQSTQHKHYKNLMHKKQNQYIKGTGMNKKEFLNKANQRTLSKTEIVIDIDEPLTKELNLKESAYAVNQMLTKKQDPNLKKELRKAGHKKHKVYYTGSKGYHIHIECTKLPMYQRRKRDEIRHNVIRFTGGDELIKGTHMIQIKKEKHWRTGNLKEEVTFNARRN